LPINVFAIKVSNILQQLGRAKNRLTIALDNKDAIGTYNSINNSDPFLNLNYYSKLRLICPEQNSIVFLDSNPLIITLMNLQDRLRFDKITGFFVSFTRLCNRGEPYMHGRNFMYYTYTSGASPVPDLVINKRKAYQGSNTLTKLWSETALSLNVDNFVVAFSYWTYVRLNVMYQNTITENCLLRIP